jgi:hypothetical protein
MSATLSQLWEKHHNAIAYQKRRRHKWQASKELPCWAARWCMSSGIHIGALLWKSVSACEVDCGDNAIGDHWLCALGTPFEDQNGSQHPFFFFWNIIPMDEWRPLHDRIYLVWAPTLTLNETGDCAFHWLLLYWRVCSFQFWSRCLTRALRWSRSRGLIKTRHKHVELGMTLTSYTWLRQTLVVGERECGDTLSLTIYTIWQFSQPLGIPVACPAVAIVAWFSSLPVDFIH